MTDVGRKMPRAARKRVGPAWMTDGPRARVKARGVGLAWSHGSEGGVEQVVGRLRSAECNRRYGRRYHLPVFYFVFFYKLAKDSFRYLFFLSRIHSVNLQLVGQMDIIPFFCTPA